MLNRLQHMKLLSLNSCWLLSLFSCLVRNLTTQCTHPVPQEPCEPPAHTPVSCLTKSPKSYTVFSENGYKLVGKIKWDQPLSTFFFLFSFNEKIPQVALNPIKTKTKPLKCFWNQLEKKTQTARALHTMFNSTASQQIQTLISPTETFYPTLFNSAHHLNHVSYEEQKVLI